MVWLIAFLSVANVALGYALAVYIHRQFGTLMLGTQGSPRATADSAGLNEDVAPPVVEQPRANNQSAPTVQTQSAPVEASAMPTEPTPVPPIEEENVLAGIEEFRSQLAKISESRPATEELDDELVEAAN